MTPDCRTKADFEVEIEPLAQFNLARLQATLAPWLTAGQWHLCVKHAAAIAQAAANDREATLEDYDIEHDPRAYLDDSDGNELAAAVGL